MKLYWHPFSIVPRRVRIAFREKGIAYEEVEVDVPGGAHRGPEFRRLNPFAQVPVLEDGDLVIAVNGSGAGTGPPTGRVAVTSGSVR